MIEQLLARQINRKMYVGIVEIRMRTMTFFSEDEVKALESFRKDMQKRDEKDHIILQ